MSTVFSIRCETCDRDGPKMRRSGKVTLCDYSVAGPFDDRYLDAANNVWWLFLCAHEFHDLRLVTGP